MSHTKKKQDHVNSLYFKLLIKIVVIGLIKNPTRFRRYLRKLLIKLNWKSEIRNLQFTNILFEHFIHIVTKILAFSFFLIISNYFSV